VLGSVLIFENRSNAESSLSGFGIPEERADAIAASLSQSGGGSVSGFGEHVEEVVEHPSP
jgi:hypothetical protein